LVIFTSKERDARTKVGANAQKEAKHCACLQSGATGRAKNRSAAQSGVPTAIAACQRAKGATSQQSSLKRNK
jgi:hypothetical protein